MDGRLGRSAQSVNDVAIKYIKIYRLPEISRYGMRDFQQLVLLIYLMIIRC